MWFAIHWKRLSKVMNVKVAAADLVLKSATIVASLPGVFVCDTPVEFWNQVDAFLTQLGGRLGEQ